MLKARSRLKTLPSSESHPSDSVAEIKKSTEPSSKTSIGTLTNISSLTTDKTHSHKRSSSSYDFGPWLSGYLKYLPTLLISFFFYGIVVHILTSVYPSEIKNWLIPANYLPFQIFLFLANFFLFSFLFQKARRGLVTALCIQTFVFLRLHSVVLEAKVIVVILVLFGTITVSADIIPTVINRIRKTNHRSVSHPHR